MSLTPAEEAKVLTWGGASNAGLAATFDRRLVNLATYAPATGVMQMSGIYLAAGTVVTNIILFSGATGVTTATHGWAALYTGSLNLLAQSTDDVTSTDYASQTKITKALTAPQTCPYSGLYYLAWMQAATTPNTMLTCSAPASTIAHNDVPIIAGTSTTGLTAAAPAAALALTGQVNAIYAYVT